MPIAKQDVPKPGQSCKPNKASPNRTSLSRSEDVFLSFLLSFRLLIVPLSFSPSLHPTSVCIPPLFLASFLPLPFLLALHFFFLSILPFFSVGDANRTPELGKIAKREKERERERETKKRQVRVTRQEHNTNPIRTITRRQRKNSRTRQARKRQSKRPNQKTHKNKRTKETSHT